MISDNSVFVFKEEINEAHYNLYLFKDFTGNEKEEVDEEIFGVIDEIRQRIYSPKTIFIICKEPDKLNKDKIEERFSQEPKFNYIDYKKIDSHIFKIGISEIVTKNNVVQYSPYGTVFRKTSGDNSSYFLKASLSLLKYPEICFIALAIYHKITSEKLLSLKRIYVDTSSIISLIQSLVNCFNMLENTNINPQIINFKSYHENSIDFNTVGAFTIISASTSGNLRKTNNIESDNCLTLFYPELVGKQSNEFCLFPTPTKIKKINIPKNPRLIPLTSEDFSLEYSKPSGVLIKKPNIEKLDHQKLIERILKDDFIDIKYEFLFDEKNKDCMNFDSDYLYKLLERNNFIKNTLLRSLSSEQDNYIIYDFKNPKEQGKGIEIKKFINGNGFQESDIKNKNVVVFLIQSNNSDLIKISQELRSYSPVNVTYIIGVMLTDSLQDSKRLESDICFNDTPYKYGFYCHLKLPLSEIVSPDIEGYNLTGGFVFYNDDATKLKPKQVYLVVCLILELLRENNELTDNISHYDVLSPKNFYRFNDSLLQLSLLHAARGRELNFCSNAELSREMRNVILDLLKAKRAVGKKFVAKLIEGHIKLTDSDREKIENDHPNLFNKESSI